MARGLLADGHTVTMVCGSSKQGHTGLSIPFNRGRRRGMVEGIDIVEFDLPYGNEIGFVRRSWLFLWFALVSVGFALRERCDCVFATSTPLTAGIPGIFARWLRRKPFVFEVRDLWPELPRAMGVITNPIVLSAMSLLEWVSYRSADRCIGLAPGIVEGITRRGVPPRRVAMIPNGCDLSLFGNQLKAWRPEGVANEDLLAVYCGTHGIANGLDAVLDAAAILMRQNRRDIHMVLIGTGREKGRLVERAQAEGLENVHFLDAVPKQRLVGLLAGADVGMQTLQNVRAFYYGTSPNKFFDYLAAGLPVLINYPGWVASLVQEYDFGFAVEPGRPDVFAAALEAAAADKTELRKKGERARCLATEQFDRAQLARNWTQWVTSGVALEK